MHARATCVHPTYITFSLTSCFHPHRACIHAMPVHTSRLHAHGAGAHIIPAPTSYLHTHEYNMHMGTLAHAQGSTHTHTHTHGCTNPHKKWLFGLLMRPWCVVRFWCRYRRTGHARVAPIREIWIMRSFLGAGSRNRTRCALRTGRYR